MIRSPYEKLFLRASKGHTDINLSKTKAIELLNDIQKRFNWDFTEKELILKAQNKSEPMIFFNQVRLHGIEVKIKGLGDEI